MSAWNPHWEIIAETFCWRFMTSGPDSEFGSLLIADTLEMGQAIGQCKIGAPDTEGICEPDIKLSPKSWGNGYGRELWSAMIDYAFQHSSADIVQGTPNRANTASVRMQLGSGMIQVDEGVFANHPSPHPGAVSVPYYKLQITEEQWKNRPNTESGRDRKVAV